MDESYINALDNYSNYYKICLSLNPFNPEDNWAFEKKRYYSNIMNNIKNNYEKMM